MSNEARDRTAKKIFPRQVLDSTARRAFKAGWNARDTEVDELKQNAINHRNKNGSLQCQLAGRDQEIHALKAEVERLNTLIDQEARLIIERDRWHEMAGKAIDAFQQLSCCTLRPHDVSGNHMYDEAMKSWAECRQALAEFEAMKKECEE